jgi:hypothetical protein
MPDEGQRIISLKPLIFAARPTDSLGNGRHRSSLATRNASSRWVLCNVPRQISYKAIFVNPHSIPMPS